ncbi:LysR family transcriptional regulator [Paraburkholderia sp. UYCP14C]|uniref:LysR family transcriptional regulator n=1 Tax=Paraburkholderia sp. UYCP14C TaxID=2511130 RepID=UPI0010211064|nr:LysR family transcriptional regulator [Paraburkholderia sp. UYCP14C]RZF25836.1 LysR family transcriptional regulator [Paraburkholderia sp. UYCP14C]
MNLTALSDFNAVATHHGFGPASRALDRPKATLSRRVAELEEELGVRLIERGSRRLRLTEDGIALHERTRGLLAELQEAGEAVASRAPVARGRLRISAPIVFAHVVLCGIAARFALEYPQVEVEIVAEDRTVDPVDEGYDLVIRVDPQRDEQLVGKRICDDERWLVATPTLAIPSVCKDDAGPIAVPAVVATAATSGAIWSVRTESRDTRAFAPMPVLRLSSLLMVREAVLAHVGAAMLPRLLVEKDVMAGRLVCWGKEEDSPVEIWALYHSRRLLSVKVRAFLEALQGIPVRS